MPAPMPPPLQPQQPPPPPQPVARAEVASTQSLRETTWCYNDEPSEVMFVRHLPTPPALPSITIKPSTIKPPPIITPTIAPPITPTPLAAEPEQIFPFIPITPPQAIQLSTPSASTPIQWSRRKFLRSNKQRQQKKEAPGPDMLFKIQDCIPRMQIIVKIPGKFTQQKSPPPIMTVKRP
ncbi:hypothetical protein Taro_014243 [Colocasia esculenta]|uniref:Uncharacterized protein n=1 Tax=Colocasia esculenta TaxID=4460 RepID=A0A843UIV1_COLES|nr:hypothetical protein [Colocasia esculenta]